MPPNVDLSTFSLALTRETQRRERPRRKTPKPDRPIAHSTLAVAPIGHRLERHADVGELLSLSASPRLVHLTLRERVDARDTTDRLVEIDGLGPVRAGGHRRDESSLLILELHPQRFELGLGQFFGFRCHRRRG